MKIVFCSLFRQSMGGGVGRIAYEISSVFAEKHQVVFVIPGIATRVNRVNKNLVYLEVKNVGKDEISIPVLNYQVIKFIFNFLDKFSADVIHVHDPGPLSFLLQLWAKENNVPFVYTSHVLPTKIGDFGLSEASGKMGKVIDNKLIKNYFSYFYKNCDGIIALNRFARDDIKNFGYRGRIFQIPNGRDIKLYGSCRVADINENEKKLVFIGYLSQRKNQKYLLQVMRCLPKNYSLDLIGDKLENTYIKNLKAYIKKYRLNVNLIGKVDYSLIPKYLEQCHLFVSASKMEVQSLVVIEALAAARPVVGLANETIEEIIDDSCGFNFPKDTAPKKFAEKIMQICSVSQEEYNRLCFTARKKASGFSWDKIREQTKKVYLSLSGEMSKTKKASTYNKSKIEKIFGELELWGIFKDKNGHKKRNRELIRFFESKKINKLKKKDLYILLLVVITVLAGSWYSFYENITNIKSKIKILTNH